MRRLPGLLQNYFINEDGTKIYSLNVNRCLKTWVNKHKNKNYKFVTVQLIKAPGKTSRKWMVSRLVYMAWVNGRIPNNKQIDHIDNNPLNNNFKNLQVLSPRENNLKRFQDNPCMSCGGAKKVICKQYNIEFKSIKCFADFLQMNYNALLRKFKYNNVITATVNNQELQFVIQ